MPDELAKQVLLQDCHRYERYQMSHWLGCIVHPLIRLLAELPDRHCIVCLSKRQLQLIVEHRDKLPQSVDPTWQSAG